MRQGLEFAGVTLRIAQGLAIDFRHIAPGAPDQVGPQADDGIAPARLAALHAFQQEGIFVGVAQLEISGDRRFQIGDMAGIDRLRPAGIIVARESREVGLKRTHRPASLLDLNHC